MLNNKADLTKIPYLIDSENQLIYDVPWTCTKNKIFRGSYSWLSDPYEIVAATSIYTASGPVLPTMPRNFNFLIQGNTAGYIGTKIVYPEDFDITVLDNPGSKTLTWSINNIKAPTSNYDAQYWWYPDLSISETIDVSNYDVIENSSDHIVYLNKEHTEWHVAAVGGPVNDDSYSKLETRYTAIGPSGTVSDEAGINASKNNPTSKINEISYIGRYVWLVFP